MFGYRNWLTLALLLLVSMSAKGQSPHGENFTMRCDACHTTSSWELDPDSLTFDHITTGFALDGQHQLIDCRLCHEELKFTGANQECMTCHTDMHQQTVGTDCARCHSPESWIVDNITQIHEQIAFPLIGAHQVPNCFECHTSETNLRFDPLGTDCINCHREDYQATANPNHQQAGYSTDCSECHTIFAFEWEATGINHDFFPLTLGHENIDCASCHTDGDYSSTSPDCIGCHEEDYNAAVNPGHMASGFSTNCMECHTTNPGWRPADFRDHDGMFFPIYSGEHNGEWSSCTDCHTSPEDFSIFSCIGCHEHNRNDMDDEHQGVLGYSYNSEACLACHPTGSEDGTLDHGFFPLTMGHAINDCAECHLDQDDYTNISPECLSCHEMDYEATQNPSHTNLGLSTDCAACHTTQPEWNPASFDVHDEYYQLNGAHAAIRNECAMCHNGDYNNTPNTCVGCHEQDFEGTTDPDHQALQFSTECTDCHNETAWTPSSFDHDGQYFPIYSGEHAGQWTSCAECHNVPGDYSIYTCTTCHTAGETGDQHDGVQGYVHNSNACLACHPMGSADDDFNHDLTGFALTGSHLTVECLECHTSGFENTPSDCYACHQVDFEGSINPDHQQLGLITDCASCHTTAPDWNPASFDIHNDYYALNGAHAMIANDCASCHGGDYVNTPNTCVGCHLEDFNATTDPDHQALQFSTECTECHGESAWTPATFDHDGQYFPIYSGDHAGEWAQCLDCHTTPGDYTLFSCTTCHEMGETDDEHEGVGGYIFNSDACLACHPTGNADEIFDHNMTGFPLTGAHTMTDCAQCHAQGFEGTPTECVACHDEDFNATDNPNHQQLGLSTDCAACHTTNPDWNPASFDQHDEFYALNGAHAMLSNDCVACHNGDYINTPTTCLGCHEMDYNSTADPDHQALQFSTECTECHNESAWIPSTFDHDGQYFPIYSGQHAGEWAQCLDCHTSPGDYSIFTCTTCHEPGETNEDHDEVPGYVYNSDACLACHPVGDADELFDHNTTGFPLAAGHSMVDCIACHEMGFEGTSSECIACHGEDFNSSTNPDHETLALSTECVICHTTAADWNPASFDIHNDYYALTGAHTSIANDCAACHNGDYSNTPNTCAGCHQNDYDQTTDPPHGSLQFSNECTECHNESEWAGAMIDHDGPYFPIYSGSHAGQWDMCSQCHTNANDYLQVTCMTCHFEAETADEHIAVAGYVFNDNACLACHPTGDAQGAFDHNSTEFPLTGAHLSVDCFSCHDPDFNPISGDCVSCHIGEYDQSSNPDHQNLNLSTDCASCHTSNPDWNPATFDVHNDYYPLNGAHASISNDCIACHNGDYTNTPSTCFGCHETDYNNTTDPDHQAAQLPTDCISCHNETAWLPSTFDHDGMYFPIYSGKHEGEWNQCADCHTNPNDYSVFDCLVCHLQGETNDDHDEVSGYIYESNACFECHPTGEN